MGMSSLHVCTSTNMCNRNKIRNGTFCRMFYMIRCVNEFVIAKWGKVISEKTLVMNDVISAFALKTAAHAYHIMLHIMYSIHGNFSSSLKFWIRTINQYCKKHKKIFPFCWKETCTDMMILYTNMFAVKVKNVATSTIATYTNLLLESRIEFDTHKSKKINNNVIYQGV